MSQREQKRPCFAEAWASAISKNGKTTTASYTYNATGIRPSKTVDGVTTQHLLDGVNVAADVTNGQVTSYIRGLSLIAVSRPDGGLLRYVTDGHGNVRALMEQGGNVAKRYSYDAFGNESNTDGNDANPFRYCGEYFDKESGSVYLRARYYSADTGIFGSEDTHWNAGNRIYGDDGNNGVPSITVIMQSNNLYAYCIGNPVRYKDKMGYEIDEDKYILDKYDYLRIKALTELYNFAASVGDTATMDKAAKYAAIIRQEHTNAGQYANSDSNGTYIDDYNYSSNYNDIDTSDIHISIKYIENNFDASMNSGVNWEFVGQAIEHFGQNNIYISAAGQIIGQLPQGPQYSVGDAIVTVLVSNVNTSFYSNVAFMGVYSYTKDYYMHNRQENWLIGQYIIPYSR